jgi:DNA-damage-inducible protein D
MKKELIHELFEKFEQACYVYKGVECWSARELQILFNYSEWRNFIKVIDKAKDSCVNVGERVPDHFVDINKMIPLAKGASREVEDIALTRYACYLIAQNGDPLKNEIAFAQTYFAVQTRKQELIEQRLLEVERIAPKAIRHYLAVNLRPQ